VSRPLRPCVIVLVQRMSRARSTLVALALALACAREPERSTEREPEPAIPTHPAIGSLTDLSPPSAAKAFADTPHFAPLREPGPSDWLASRKEPGQTVAQYIADGPIAPTAERDVIYLQPIGPFSTKLWPSIQTLADYTGAFFGLEVVILDPVTVESLHATTREWDYGPQLRTDDVLVALERLLPPDAFLLVGLTMTDLYPGDDWNYVFGFASLEKRVSVYSLLRFDPIHDGPVEAAREPELRRALILRRSLKVMSHELTHSFGIRHCIHYDCLMNGANHVHEVDEHPIHVCPVCLRKLHVALELDPIAHYTRLGAFYSEHGIVDAAEWTAERLHYLRAEPRP
jgi:archaemetzincin